MPMPPRPEAHLNRIATAVPEHEVHGFFQGFAEAQLARKPRERALFGRMLAKAGIERRFSVLEPNRERGAPALDTAGLFVPGAFSGTAERMDVFERHAPELAMRAIEGLGMSEDERRGVTHLVVATCTGFSAPGLDLEIVRRLGLPDGIERVLIGFMGCYAAINALKLARHLVRSEPGARVLVVNCELCTLHLKESDDLERLLTFCLWGDGCSAALVSARPEGFRMDAFHAAVARAGAELMTWNVRDDGFDMVLSGRVPGAVGALLADPEAPVPAGPPVEEVSLWAVHPGGRSVLDAVQKALALPQGALAHSREVLRENGNMSSATVMFVLERMLGTATRGDRGCAMAFGPGLTAETMNFVAA
jgi:predicted naringenin-chalcone synthase